MNCRIRSFALAVTLLTLSQNAPCRVVSHQDATPKRVEKEEKACRHYPVGTNSYVSLGGKLRSMEFSPDGSTIVVTSADKATKFIDPETGEFITSFQDQNDVCAAQFSPDGSKLLRISYPDSNIINAKTGTILSTFRPGGEIRAAQFMADGSKLLAVMDRSLWVLDPTTGNNTHVGWIEGPFSISPDSSKVVTIDKNGLSGRLFETGTGDTIQWLEFSEPVKAVRFSHDSARFFVKLEKRTNSMDAHTGKVIHSIPHPEAWKDPHFSDDGSKFQFSDNYSTRLFDGKTGKWIRCFQQSTGGELSPDGTKMLTRLRYDSDYSLIDTESGRHMGKVRGDKHEFTPDSSRVLSQTNSDFALRDAKTGDTLASFHSFLPTEERGNYLPPRPKLSPDGSKIISLATSKMLRITKVQSQCITPVAEDLSLIHIDLDSPRAKRFCTGGGETSFDSPWPNESEQGPKFSHSAWLAEAHRKRLISRLWEWQKPGGLDLKRDLSALIGILRQKTFCKKNPEIILGVLENLLPLSEVFYDHLLIEFPYLKDLERKQSFSCRTKKETERLLVAAEARLNRTIGEFHNQKVTQEQYNSLAPLSGLFASLSDEKKETYLAGLTEPIVARVLDSETAAGIFGSQIHKFVKQRIKPLLGLKPKALTDLSIVRTERGFKVIALGTDYLLNYTPDSGEYQPVEPEWEHWGNGLVIRVLASVPIANSPRRPNIPDREFDWSHGGKRWKAKVSFHHGVSNEMNDQRLSPPFDVLNKGGLSGLVMVGASIMASDYELNEYRSLFIKKGYKFLPEKEVNSREYLLAQVESGELDYLVKEAHSDGDYQNLFHFHSKATIHRGIKQNADGTEDVIELLYPDTTSPPDKIANRVFGAAIKKRGTPLVYFNTSCWSVHKAIHEIPWAGKNLIEIASTGLNITVREGNSSSLMIESFLDRKTYAEMRQAMAKDKISAEEKLNQYLFPDDSSYWTKIGGLVTRPISVAYTLISPTGTQPTLAEQEEQEE